MHHSEALSKRECASQLLEVLNKNAPSSKQDRWRTGLRGQIYLNGLKKPSCTLVMNISNQQLIQTFTLLLLVYFRVGKCVKIKIKRT